MFPSTGWVGFDPANHCTVGENFVKVAVGRDYRDVPPNKGVYRGKAKETIEVQVHSEELETIPPELAAERMQSLNIPTLRRASRVAPRAGQPAAGTSAATAAVNPPRFFAAPRVMLI